MKNIKPLVTAGIFASSLSFCLQAEIESIVVTGARTPINQAQLAGTYTVIDSEKIANSQAVGITDLLRGLPSISVSQSGAKGALNELRIRGSESNHVLVLIDGVEINDQGQGGLVNFAHINVENIERIEILKGPQSALWGSGAVGGVISITTKRGLDNTSGHLKLELGNQNSRHYSSNLSGVNSGLSYGVAVSHFDTEGSNISRQGNEYDGYESSQLSTNLKWHLNDNSALLFNLRLVDATNEFDNTDFVTSRPADSDSYTDVKQQSGKLVWQYQPENSSWQQQVGLQLNDNENETFNNELFDGGSQSDKQRWYWQSHFGYSDNSHINFVAEHIREDFEQQGQVVYGDPNQTQSNKVNSAVVDVLHQLSTAISVSASVRHDDNDVYENATSYQTGITYQANDNTKLYASYGQAVKTPTFTETFGYFPASFVGNPQLEPEQSRSWELGGQFVVEDNWVIDINYFESDLEDEIQTIFLPDFTSTSINVTGESQRRGVELSISGNVGALDIIASYGFLDAEQPDAADKLQTELRRAKNTASLSLNYGFLNNKANAYLQASYQGKQYDNNFATFPATRETLDGYTLINMALSYNFSHKWQATLRAENLFDKGYEDVYGYVGQGRLIYAGAQYRF